MHLAAAALALDNSSIAARIARFLGGHPDTAGGMYGHDRRTLRAVLDATAGVLAASRQLLMVVESIVAHQRDRLASSEADGPDDLPERDEPTRIDLSY